MAKGNEIVVAVGVGLGMDLDSRIRSIIFSRCANRAPAGHLRHRRVSYLPSCFNHRNFLSRLGPWRRICPRVVRRFLDQFRNDTDGVWVRKKADALTFSANRLEKLTASPFPALIRIARNVSFFSTPPLSVSVYATKHFFDIARVQHVPVDDCLVHSHSRSAIGALRLAEKLLQ